MDETEITAYHEAGHAIMGLVCGARILRLSIEPNNEHGPKRFGESIVQWPRGATSMSYVFETRVSLAGPVAEMTYTGNWQPIDEVDEFALKTAE